MAAQRYKARPPESVLVVSAFDKGHAFIGGLLEPGAYAPVAAARSGGEARRMLGEGDYDFVVVDTPLPDEFGDELAVFAVEQSGAGVLLIVRGELYEGTSAKAEELGVLTLSKPLSAPLFHAAFRLLSAARVRMRRYASENRRLRIKLEEIKLVSRAKYLLIERLGMSEQQAHRYIEKQAMDLRETKREVAESILKTYEY